MDEILVCLSAEINPQIIYGGRMVSIQPSYWNLAEDFLSWLACDIHYRYNIYQKFRGPTSSSKIEQLMSNSVCNLAPRILGLKFGLKDLLHEMILHFVINSGRQPFLDVSYLSSGRILTGRVSLMAQLRHMYYSPKCPRRVFYLESSQCLRNLQ